MTWMSVITVQQILLNIPQHFPYYLYEHLQFSLIVIFLGNSWKNASFYSPLHTYQSLFALQTQRKCKEKLDKVSKLVSAYFTKAFSNPLNGDLRIVTVGFKIS